VVKRDAVKREIREGVEHVVVSAATLPDNVVMNGGLYPAEEIAKSFHGLERKLAPVGHPSNGADEFVSASDPVGIHQFYAGAWNENVRREDGRVLHDVAINVAEAGKTDRGRRLLDRVVELETNERARPIHTSVGLWLSVEPVPTPKTNAAGDEYNWVARDLDFDHNAILLDGVGAAQPGQGVGMAVNQDGAKVEVDSVALGPTPPRVLVGNEDGSSQSEVHQAIREAFERSALEEPDYLEEIYPDVVIYRADDTFYRVPYRLDGSQATIVGLPEPVDRRVTYELKTNSDNGDNMKELILNALTGAGVPTEGLDDTALLAAYQTLTANADTEQSGAAAGGDGSTEQPDATSTALNALTEKLTAIELKLNAQSTAEVEQLAGLVLNSKRYPGLDEAALKGLPLETLKGMASHLGTSVGLPPALSTNSGEADLYAAPTEMPQ
jgi:hypothetical protein